MTQYFIHGTVQDLQFEVTLHRVVGASYTPSTLTVEDMAIADRALLRWDVKLEPRGSSSQHAEVITYTCEENKGVFPDDPLTCPLAQYYHKTVTAKRQTFMIAAYCSKDGRQYPILIVALHEDGLLSLDRPLTEGPFLVVSDDHHTLIAEVTVVMNELQGQNTVEYPGEPTSPDHLSLQSSDALHRLLMSFYRQVEKSGSGDIAASAALMTTGYFTDMPKANEVRCNWMGQISTARGFDQPYLFIRYHVIPPSDVIPSEDKTELESNVSVSQRYLTQTAAVCRCYDPVIDTSSSTYTFCHPFELNATTRGEAAGRILVEVFSINMWGSHVLEGYGLVNLCPTPGMHESHVRVFRPVGSLYDTLHGYFLGGTPEYHDISELLTAHDHSGFLNRLGSHTIGSGSVHIKWQCARQQRGSTNVRRSNMLRESTEALNVLRRSMNSMRSKTRRR
eukprot:PhF_6_TR3714/c0_g1_i1/m.5310/K19332/MKS1; Meckel syndrome type 1 protein